MNDAIEKLIREFRPKMGDEHSIQVMHTVERYRKAQHEVTQREKNRLQYERAVRKSTQAERDVARLENSLMSMLSTQSTELRTPTTV